MKTKLLYLSVLLLPSCENVTPEQINEAIDLAQKAYEIIHLKEDCCK